MKLRDITDVLTFAAFRPEPDDAAAPWTRRFPNRKTLLLNVAKNRTSWKSLGRNGNLTDAGTQNGDFKDIASAMAPEWRKLTEEGWCCVSINSRYVISLESNLPRKEGIEDIMRMNPRAALGSKFERSKRYALVNNPEHGAGIVLSCDDEVVKKIEATLSEIGLKPGRICCGTYSMLRRAIEHVNNDSRPDKSPASTRLFVICCEGSICLLTQTDDTWSELRSRSDFYVDDTRPVLDMIAPAGRSEDSQPSEVFYAADQAELPLAKEIGEKFPRAKITDLTQPDHLWRVISDLH